MLFAENELGDLICLCRKRLLSSYRGLTRKKPGVRSLSSVPVFRACARHSVKKAPKMLSKPSSGLPGMIRSLMSSWGARRSASTLAKVGETFPLCISSEPCKSSRHILLMQQTYCNRQLQHNVCFMVVPDDHNRLRGAVIVLFENHPVFIVV